MDPNATDRYNQVVRFSNVAQILRLQIDGKEFLASPVGPRTDGDGGLAMEFDLATDSFMTRPPNFAEAITNGAGDSGNFIKIGVGVLKKTTGNYEFYNNYPVVQRAATTVTWGQSTADFVQICPSVNGYAYELRETVALQENKLVLSYALKNTGTKSLVTEQNIHNFFDFGPVGPGIQVDFPYDFQPLSQQEPLLTKIGQSVAVNQVVASGHYSKMFAFWPTDPSYAGPSAHTVNAFATGQSVVADASLPSNWTAVFVGYGTMITEANIALSIAPGQEASFTRTYTLSVPEPASLAMLFLAPLAILRRRRQPLA